MNTTNAINPINSTNPKINELPSVSIVIPTLNSAKTLRDCLESIAVQDYPKDRIETIIADAGSTDRTLEIINSINSINATNSINLKVVPNPLKTGEAGKAIGVKAARNEIIVLIDSDNILPDKDWLLCMVEPLEDLEIVGSEPLYYSYRKEDGYITRYCALLGMNDPLCLFLGNYDRYSTLTGKWTEMPHKEEDRGNYLKVELDKNHLPTIGANGFLIRRSALLSVFASGPPLSVHSEQLNAINSMNPTNSINSTNILFPDYLFDIDIICQLLNPTNHLRLAKVKTGIVHIFSGDVTTFARKQRRRIRDYLFYDKLGIREYPWESTSKLKLLKFILSCLTIFPLLIQSIKGYIRKPDRAWFFHPLASWITLWEYGWGRISTIFGAKEFRRERWRQ